MGYLSIGTHVSEERQSDGSILITARPIIDGELYWTLDGFEYALCGFPIQNLIHRVSSDKPNESVSSRADSEDDH